MLLKPSTMSLTNLIEEFYTFSKRESYGELTLRHQSSIWTLQIFRGKLLYATSKLHPVRRWDRVLRQHCRKWNWSHEFSLSLDDQFWECELLNQGMSQSRLSSIQAKLVIRSVFQECLFDLSTYPDYTVDWVEKPKPANVSSLISVIALSPSEIQTLLTTATRMRQQWSAAGLGQLSPDLSPVLTQAPDSEPLTIAPKYLSAEFTLWDIALELEKSVIEVAESLQAYAEQGILTFQTIPDLLSVTAQPSTTASPTARETKPTRLIERQPIIACIDDSPVLAHTLKKILAPAGYQVLSIPEPMRGFSELIEHKPDLILLDLLLPNADGYSICKFLRDTPVFKATPIIILTGKNSSVDRSRAQLVGATEFLSKPPQAQELLQMVRKYLFT